MTPEQLFQEKYEENYIDRLLHTIFSNPYDVARVNNTTFDDLRQAGLIGLWRAALKFDPKKKVKFSTFSYYWIFHEIMDAMGDGIVVYVPKYLRRKEEIREKVKTSSINAKVEDKDGKEQEMIELLPPEEFPEDRVVSDIDVERWLEDIEGEDRRILSFFITDETLASIGEDLGLTREGVRLRKEKLKRRLRKKGKRLLS